MGMQFHIEGTEEFGYITFNRCLFSFYNLLNTVKKVCAHYNNASVWDLNGYAAHFCYLRLKSFDTLLKIVKEQNDFISASCLLRMLGDSVAVFHLIYMEPDPDWRWLRHALYIIDGCEQNMKALPENDLNEGTMPDDELEIFKEQNRHNRALRERLKYQAQQIVDRSPLQNLDREAFDKIVTDKNWKFKEFKTYKKVGSNQYKWTELYERIEMCEGYDVLSFISQYAHGLSMSNLVMEMNERNLDAVIGETFALIKRLNTYMMHYYLLDYHYIMNGLLEPDMRDKILSCYDDEHRPSIETWNQQIRDLISRKEFLC